MASLQDESIEAMRARLERVRDDPAQVAALAGEFLDLAGRMAVKAEKLARIGDRTQARMVELNRKLRQQEQRYRGIFENSTGGIFLADADGSLMAANPALLDLLDPGGPAAGPRGTAAGLPPETAAVASLFFDEADWHAFARALAETGRVQRLEVRLKTPRGPLWCLVGAARIEPDGHVVGMTQDISSRKALEDELVRRAASDALTGLANRRGFFENAVRAQAVAVRSKAPLGMIMVDVDHFKNVNDTYGHDVGDTVLRAVAGRLRDGVRLSDMVGRVGGEEFAVLCPGTDLAGGEELAERLRRALEVLCIEAGDRRIRVTASFGVAVFIDGLDAEPAACLARADKALYAAKRSGRNRVCLDRGTLPAIACRSG
ncbi:diguanylate cyclase [Desulfovibrio aerotolerans]|uniref:diguanylate cyclase n=1 Tax=Solidesulfovibrio aerotolerans TaxID=295255 RepID=A0A7C9MHG5_9BACT|nr:sensor domain-containing diguanylate cyclase [Solidesulfovibrio aerotolerans]MYL81849.1 diguanylate cyclase [Solidesulfovibrio aerotolerans]